MTQFSITINGEPFKDLDHPRLQEALARSHKKNTTYCQCCPWSPLPLVIKHYNADTPLSSYGLALWPDTGLEHHHDCYFFGEDTTNDQIEGPKPPFEDLPNGKSRAYLATALQIIAKNVRAIEARKKSEQPATKRRRAGELLLLMKIWRKSGLNIYKGYERKWYQAGFQILKAASNIVINAEGETLDQYLLIGCGSNDKMVNEHNTRVLERVKQRYTRLFVIGRLKSYSVEKQRQMLVLKDFSTLPRISIQSDQIRSLIDADSFLQNAIHDECINTIVIACIEPTNTEWWNALHIHALTTSPDLLPIKNEEEQQFTHHLVEQERKFLVPIHMDPVSVDDKRPEFILLDTPERTYCEVFPISTPYDAAIVSSTAERYEARHQHYFAWYRNKGSIPTLPDKHRTPSSGVS